MAGHNKELHEFDTNKNTSHIHLHNNSVTEQNKGI